MDPAGRRGRGRRRGRRHPGILHLAPGRAPAAVRGRRRGLPDPCALSRRRGREEPVPRRADQRRAPERDPRGLAGGRADRLALHPDRQGAERGDLPRRIDRALAGVHAGPGLPRTGRPPDPGGGLRLLPVRLLQHAGGPFRRRAGPGAGDHAGLVLEAAAGARCGGGVGVRNAGAVKPHGLTTVSALGAVAVLDAATRRDWARLALRAGLFTAVFFAAGNAIQFAAQEPVGSPLTFFMSPLYDAQLAAGSPAGAGALGAQALAIMVFSSLL